MKCPRDGRELTQRKVKGRDTQVDVCEGCHGIWFDDGELASVIGAKAVTRLDIPPHALRIPARCPRCDTQIHILPYPGTMTIVDVCSICRGVWLDRAEVRAIEIARGMTCPKCGHEQSKSKSCAACGIVIEKFIAREQQQEDALIGAGFVSRAPAASTAEGKAESPAAKSSVKDFLLQFIDDSIEAMTGRRMGSRRLGEP